VEDLGGVVGVGANGLGILGLGMMLLGAGCGYGGDLGWVDWSWGGGCDLGNRGLEVGKVAWVWRLTRW